MAELKKYCCDRCKKVLFHGEIKEGIVSKDCPKCGHRNVITVTNAVVSISHNPYQKRLVLFNK